jgi:hypothetical protein
MSSMQGLSYLTGLLEQANTIRASEIAKTQQLAASQRKADRMVNLRNQYNVIPTAIRPRQTSYLEQTTQNRPVSSTGISDIYKAAKEYNPLGTTLAEEKLKEPLTYLSKLKTETSVSALGDALNATGKMFAGEEAKTRDWGIMNSLEKEIKRLTSGSYRTASGNHGYYVPPTAAELNAAAKLQTQLKELKLANPESIQERNRLTRDWNNLRVVNRDFIAPQQTALSNLIAEQEKYFGKDFANVSKEQLTAADWTAWQQLSGDITKYTDLRDTYINKFKSDPSKFNKDWIKSYNDLITSTATSMTAEIPKILQTATNTAASIKQTQQATLSTLETLDKSFGTQARIPAEQRKVMDVNSAESRQQALARVQRVGSFTKGVKPAPKFESRPY